MEGRTCLFALLILIFADSSTPTENLSTENVKKAESNQIVDPKEEWNGPEKRRKCSHGQSSPPCMNTDFPVDPCYYESQCVDHDDPKCTQKWRQRYWATSYHYSDGGPLFVFFGGEVSTSSWANGNAWQHYARKMSAYTLAIEHRFYGESWPTTPQTNRSAAAMKILTSQQALKDYAQLIQWFKNGIPGLKNAQVVVFGGSYAGGLVSWFKSQFPGLANVAVASSAPLNYTYEFPEYVGVSGKAIKDVSSPCFKAIKSAFTCMETIVNGDTCSDTSTTDPNDLPGLMGQCDTDFTDDNDKSQFFIAIGRSVWAGNNAGTSAVSPCKALLKETEKNSDILVAYGNFVSVNHSASCSSSRRKRPPRQAGIDVNNNSAANSTNDPGGYSYSWFWQSCHEFVNFQVDDPVSKMLGKNLFGSATEVNSCQYWYPDAGFTEKTIKRHLKKTQNQYKHGNEYNGTCVIFVNGGWDPWHTKSITKESDTSPLNTVYWIPNGEHLDDMFHPPSNQFANSDIHKVQKKILKQIGVYLNSPDCQTTS